MRKELAEVPSKGGEEIVSEQALNEETAVEIINIEEKVG